MMFKRLVCWLLEHRWIIKMDFEAAFMAKCCYCSKRTIVFK